MGTEDNMNIYEFFSDVFFYMIILLLVFQKVMFNPLGELSDMQSKSVLYVLVVLTLVWSVWIFSKHKRNGWNVFLTVFFPYGLYSTLASFSNVTYIKIILFIVLILIILLILLICRYYPRKRLFSRKFVFKIIYLSQCIIAGGMFTIFAITFAQELHDNGIFRVFDKSVVSGEDSGETIEKNIDTILLLETSKWKELDKSQKLLVMQTVANIEANYLGLAHELHVQVGNLSDGTLGTYVDSDHTITIDAEHMMSSDSFEVLRTVLHESFHGYSYRLIELYQDADEDLQNLKLLQNARKYETEFGNYIDPDIDYEEYYNMKSEEDARLYAENGLYEYHNRINEYLGIETEESILSDLYDDERYKVSYLEDGNAYLYDLYTDECIAGPYQMIYVDELRYQFDTVCRYIGLNGKTGYLSKEGKEITPPMFVDASEMQNGIAMVKEGSSGYYYIDSDGMRIIEEEYNQAHEFEHQGMFARVKIDEGIWAIINRKGETVFTAESIEPLPIVTTLGGAVVNGHAVIFEMDFTKNKEISVVKHLEEYSEISEIYCGYFAIVKAKNDNNYGVVDNTGNVVIPAVYYDIDYEFNEYTESFGQKTDFICTNSDGTKEVIKIEW